MTQIDDRAYNIALNVKGDDHSKFYRDFLELYLAEFAQSDSVPAAHEELREVRRNLEGVVKKSFLTSLDPVHLGKQLLDMVAEAKKAISAIDAMLTAKAEQPTCKESLQVLEQPDQVTINSLAEELYRKNTGSVNLAGDIEEMRCRYKGLALAAIAFLNKAPERGMLTGKSDL